MIQALPGAQGLAIRALGGFEVSVGSRRIDPADWQLKKAASLFKYMAIKHPAWIPREEFLEIFWADLRPENAERAFRTTIHVLRRVLQPNLPRYAPSAYLEHRDALYRLRPETILWFDVERFLDASRRFQAAQRSGERNDAIAAAREAIDLYGGALYPEDPYEDWAMDTREALHQEYLDLVEAFGRLTLSDVDPASHLEAVQILRRAVQSAEERESLYFLLMRHLAALGRTETALKYFQRYVKIAEEELGSKPGVEISRFAENLQKQAGHLDEGTALSGLEVPGPPAVPARVTSSATTVAYLVDLPTFRKLVAWEQRKVERQGTPSSLVLLQVAGNRKPGRANGVGSGEAARERGFLQPWQQAILERLRRLDVAALPAPQRLALLLPQADTAGVARILDRLRPAIALSSGASRLSVTVRVLGDRTRSQSQRFSLTLR